MARLAAGDHAAVLVLVEAHHDRVAATLLANLADEGCAPPSPGDLSLLVLAAGFAIADAAALGALTGAGARRGADGPWERIAPCIRGLATAWAGLAA